MEKINVAELLKDCVSGMELDCTICDNIYFDKVTPNMIKCFIKNGTYNTIYFHHDGTYLTTQNAKCVIFPKGKTTWEGFQRPFKDGDILTNKMGNIFIYKSPMDYNELLADFYCGYRISDEACVSKLFKTEHFGDVSECRFATEKEKQKLFDAIKSHGYKWNNETKTLEKLIVPKFKVGDRVKKKGAYTNGIITDISNGTYEVEYKGGDVAYANIEFQDDWELVPNKFDISTLVPFESRVLVRNLYHYEWEGAIFGRYDGKNFFTIGGLDWGCCIPYEGNEHLLGKTDDCDDFYKTWE